MKDGRPDLIPPAGAIYEQAQLKGIRGNGRVLQTGVGLDQTIDGLL